MVTTVFDASATLAGTDDGNGNGNFNLRQLFAPAAFGAATGDQIRFTFLFGTGEGTEAAAIDAVYVGQKTTTAIASASLDTIFTGNQVQVTVGGSTSINGSASGVVTSDWITLGEAFDPTKGYMVSWHGASGKNCNVSLATFSNTAQTFCSTSGGSTASLTVAVPSFDQLNASSASLISKIEIQASGPPPTPGPGGTLSMMGVG